MVAGPSNGNRPVLGPGAARIRWEAPVVQGDEGIMKPKSHGTSSKPVQSNLRWGCDVELADRICNFNRHSAEDKKYFLKTDLAKEAAKSSELRFFDSNTGKLLFTVSSHGNRGIEGFLSESNLHGWPSFRDRDVNWKEVRVLSDGEVVSSAGTHLGHVIPDHCTGNRYCINIVSIAGRPRKSAVPCLWKPCFCRSVATVDALSLPLKPGHHYVLRNNRLRPPFPAHLSVCCFGAGCFWGIEKGFWRLPGVYSTAVGFCGGHDFATEPSYMYVCTGDSGHAEVVQVVWDPNLISFGDLLHHFWQCHDPTQGNRQGVDKGTQYRSGIFCTTECQALVAQASRGAFNKVLQAKGYPPITTEICQDRPFWFAEDSHQQYLAKQPRENQHCSAEPTGEAPPSFDSWHWSPKAHTMKAENLRPMLPQAFWQVFDWGLGAPNEPASADPIAISRAMDERTKKEQTHNLFLQDCLAKHTVVLQYCSSRSYERRAIAFAGYVKRVCDLNVGLFQDLSITGNFELHVKHVDTKMMTLAHSKRQGKGFIDTVSKVEHIFNALAQADPTSWAHKDFASVLATASMCPGLHELFSASDPPSLPLETCHVQPPASVCPLLLQRVASQKQSSKRKQSKPKKDRLSEFGA